MDAAKRARLEAQGWSVGSAADFLALTPEEAALVEMKVALSDALRRRSATLPQSDVAKNVHVSVRPVLAGEGDGAGVSLEWLIRALLAVGATPQEIGTLIARTAR